MQNLERRVKVIEDRSEQVLKVGKITSWLGTWGGTAIATTSVVSAMKTEYPELVKVYLTLAGLGIIGAASCRLNVERVDYLQHRREGAHIVMRKKIIYEAPVMRKNLQPGASDNMTSPVTPLVSR